MRAVVQYAHSQKSMRSCKSFGNVPSDLDFTISLDMTVPCAYFEALRSDPPFDIISIVSPVLFRAVSSNADFIDTAVKAASEILKAIKTNTLEVKRLVFTSSCVRVIG